MALSFNSKRQHDIEGRVSTIRTHTLVNTYEAGYIRITHYANGNVQYFVGEYQQSNGQWLVINYKILMHDVSNPETIQLYVHITADRTQDRYAAMFNHAAWQEAREHRRAAKAAK